MSEDKDKDKAKTTSPIVGPLTSIDRLQAMLAGRTVVVPGLGQVEILGVYDNGKASYCKKKEWYALGQRKEDSTLQRFRIDIKSGLFSSYDEGPDEEPDEEPILYTQKEKTRSVKDARRNESPG